MYNQEKYSHINQVKVYEIYSVSSMISGIIKIYLVSYFKIVLGKQFDDKNVS